MTQANKGTAVITGASTGMGAVYADRLARQGYDLVLIARDEERLGRVASLVRAATERKVEVLAADLVDPQALRRVEALLRVRADVTLMVNNAGIGSVAPLHGDDVDAMERMIALNVTAPTRLTYAVAPGMAARGAGAIVNVSSIVAIATEMMNGVYGASKSYVLAFTQALQHEFGAKGLRIQAVLPGVTATGFWDTLGHPLERLPAGVIMSVDDLVDAALAGLAQGERVTIPGLHDGEKWTAHDAARRELAGLFGNAAPAPRYAVPARQAA
ncbi:SDR family NAD(P)-dependent oxidoreductase [Massilia oculi]|uniref:NADP-dependent 3-hydroxy acid dehydrogenase YdfG n=1 Tax=Massilia oculi TaxID=945844 RepID=A0A2S2DM42_9BURK|nr:SDR family oxidoreductase [Massilia oculi]AWL06397.1 SDR family oxidoreductase [Massilia oculi]